MRHVVNADVARHVPSCAEKVSPTVYFMAVRCDTYEQAYAKLRKIEHLLPIPLVKPWQRIEKNQSKVLATTSQYTQGGTALADHGYRATEVSRSVDRFSEEAERMGKISPRKGSRRIPAKDVCPGCGGDMHLSWAMSTLANTVTTDHSKCITEDERK
jgi:hypothetical protein